MLVGTRNKSEIYGCYSERSYLTVLFFQNLTSQRMASKDKIPDPNFQMLILSVFFNEENELIPREELLLKKEIFEHIKALVSKANQLKNLQLAREHDSGLAILNLQLSESDYIIHGQTAGYAHFSVEALINKVEIELQRFEN